MFRVIENVPGYLPDSPDPVDFDDRDEAIAYACNLAKELEDDNYATRTEGADPFTIRARRDDGDRMIQVVPVTDVYVENVGQHVIGSIETSANGNVILRIGEINGDGKSWTQVAHVVLSPTVAREKANLILRLTS